MNKEMFIDTGDHEIRVAIMEDGKLTEFFMERSARRSIVGNIYKGKVTKILPGMQSAFVNIGLGKDAFLFVADVRDGLQGLDSLLGVEQVAENGPDPRSPEMAKRPIADLLKEGQEILVQVAKEPMGGKGARITSHITLPGRYLVYMPTVSQAGVSRKIEAEDERERLRNLVQEIKSPHEGCIVRTAGEGRTRPELELDHAYLSGLWKDLRATAEKPEVPALVHEDLDLVQRLMRDLFSSEFSAVWLDSEETQEKCRAFVHRVQPHLTPRIKKYGNELPMFDHYNIHAELEKALSHRVWLKSGGHIVINQTEALVAIDVNTGKYVGKKKLEDTVLKTNLEAVREIVRQVRLRDLGGILVIDFIDMEELENREKLIEAFTEELKKDRSRTRVTEISDFGLMQVTRKRVKASLEKTLCRPCPYCSGTGRIKSPQTISSQIRRDILKLADTLDGDRLYIRVHPDVAEAFEENDRDRIKRLSKRLAKEISLQADETFHREHYDMACIDSGKDS